MKSRITVLAGLLAVAMSGTAAAVVTGKFAVTLP